MAGGGYIVGLEGHDIRVSLSPGLGPRGRAVLLEWVRLSLDYEGDLFALIDCPSSVSLMSILRRITGSICYDDFLFKSEFLRALTSEQAASVEAFVQFGCSGLFC